MHRARSGALAPLGGAPGPTQPATSGRAARCRAARSARRGRPPWWWASPHWLPAYTTKKILLTVTVLHSCSGSTVLVLSSARLLNALAEHKRTCCRSAAALPQVEGQRLVSKTQCMRHGIMPHVCMHAFSSKYPCGPDEGWRTGRSSACRPGSCCRSTRAPPQHSASTGTCLCCLRAPNDMAI